MNFKLLVWLLGVIPINLAWHIIGIVRYKSKPDYILTWAYRGMCLVIFGVWITIDLTQPKEIGYFFPIFVYCITSYILVFNPAINMLKNKFADAKHAGFWYMGKTSGFFWDDFWIKYPWLYKVVYFASVPAFLWSLYKMKMYL